MTERTEVRCSLERQLSAIGSCRDLLLLLPDQLDRRYPVRLGLDPQLDVICLPEVASEVRPVIAHRQRTAWFLAAMRQAVADLREAGWRVIDRRLGEPASGADLACLVEEVGARLGIRRLLCLRPGSWRAVQALEELAERAPFEVAMREDPHFLCSPAEFETWASGRSPLVMEHFYRKMRRREDVLMEDGGPVGGRWNFDRENRQSLPASSGELPQPDPIEGDALLESALSDVARRFPDDPGVPGPVVWPVTREGAKRRLHEFVGRRLERFGPYQDAMSSASGWLFHSWLSPLLNAKLLDPRECIEAAVNAWRAGTAPLQSVEGFVRQILGWREFIRGVYWREGPGYALANHLEHDLPLPKFYWNGDTEMRCVAGAVGHVLRHGYGHHIERLMVTGNLALLLGVAPAEVNDWYLGMFVDSMEWVTEPNTLGMSQFADGGVVGTKPYVSTGRYIDRMSDHCRECAFDPARREGETACPFTTLYWDFLARHEPRLRQVPRMGLALRNLNRLSVDERAAVRSRADALRGAWCGAGSSQT